jgi:outer membrane biosynthesis protein TonB
MAIGKKGGFGFDLESQFKNMPSIDEVEPVDLHIDTQVDAPAEVEAVEPVKEPVEKKEEAEKPVKKRTKKEQEVPVEQPVVIDMENKTKRTNGLVKQTVFDKVTAYAKANRTSYNAIVCELLDEFIREKGL